jgi:hypothetical protein
MSPSGIFWTFASLVLSGLALYVVFKAKVSIEPDTPILAKEAIQIPINITNNSILPVYSLQLDCIIISIGGGNPGWVLDNSHMIVDSVIPKLESGETTSIHARSNLVSGAPVTHGDIVFVVKYTPSILWWRRLKAINRFEATIDEDGKLRWYHKARSEPLPSLPPSQ